MFQYFRINAFQLLVVFGFVLGVLSPRLSYGQGFFDFERVIPERDPIGKALPGANTTFADGTLFVPDVDVARSTKWTWRQFGNGGILSSFGPGTTTPPSSTKELVTTVKNLKPGANYAVKVLFWSNDTSLWGVRAGLNYANGTRTNIWFDNQSSLVMESGFLPWGTIPAIFNEGGRILYAASIGTGTANANGELKVFIHDLPSGDSNRRVWYNGVAISQVTTTAQHQIDLEPAGTPFSRGVRGLALISITIDRGEYHVGIPKSLEIARGSSIRGVATGLAAEIYDWRTRNGQASPPTLDFLRYSRDFEAELFLGANMRGLIELNPEGGWRYYDTNIATLATMAGDWVRYVNHIVPSYRQGDSITNSRDAAILDSLTWSSAGAGDSFDKLLAPTEPAVPLIRYWEIGNEPTYGVKAYAVSNSFTLSSNEYRLRYAAISAAIRAEDPTVKVGPTLAHASRESDQLHAVVSDPSLPVDFITYHPYERMGTLTDAAEITRHLGSVHSRQMHHLNDIKSIVLAGGRNADAIEYAATEVNVSSWDTNDTDKEARMAHALGTVETVFSHARLGLVASLYWIWATHRWDGTEYPVFKAYEKLRDHLGDTLISIYAYGNIRVYTTRDSRTGELAVWALNFSNDTTTSVALELSHLPTIERATLHRLADKSGSTTLFSANLSTEMPGGPATHVEWTSSNITAQVTTNLQLSLPPATLSLIVMETGLENLSPALIDNGAEKRFSVSFNQVPHASAVRYELLRSVDLVNWNVVDQTGPVSGNVISLRDPEPPISAASRFFRVRVVRD